MVLSKHVIRVRSMNQGRKSWGLGPWPQILDWGSWGIGGGVVYGSWNIIVTYFPQEVCSRVGFFKKSCEFRPESRCKRNFLRENEFLTKRLKINWLWEFFARKIGWRNQKFRCPYSRHPDFKPDWRRLIVMNWFRIRSFKRVNMHVDHKGSSGASIGAF